MLFLSASEAKAGLVSNTNNTKNNVNKIPAASFDTISQKAGQLIKTLTNTGKNFGESLAGDVKDFGATVGNTMGAAGSAFESTIQDGENNIVGLINGAQKKVQKKIGKIGEKTAAPVNASQKEDSLKAKTVEKKVAIKNQKTYSIFQAGLDKIKNISKDVINAGKDLGETFVEGAKDFSATINSAVESAATTVESGVKKGGEKVNELADAAQDKIGEVGKKSQSLVGDIFGSSQKTADKPAAVTPKPTTTKKPGINPTTPAQDTAAQTKPDASPKPQLTVYSNANSKKETVEKLAPQTKSATATDTVPAKSETSDKTLSETKSETKNNVTTLQDIKVLGTIDFTEATVAGLQQTIVNNYSSGPSMMIYNETKKQNESLQMISGAGGGVARGFSVGTNLDVGNSSDSTSGHITATGNITASGNITVSGSGSFGSLAIASLTASGNANVSGTLQVTNTTTLYNDLFVGATAESIADPGFIFNGNDAYFHDKIGVNGIAYLDGAVQASSTLLVGTATGIDNFFVNGNNTYVATSTAYGTAYSLIVGNGTTGAMLAGGHVSPSHTGLFDLGRNGLGWNNIYTSSTIYAGAGGTSLSTLAPNILAFAGSIGAVSSTAGNLRLAADGANQLQLWTNGSQRAFIDSSGNTFASGTLQATGNATFYGDTTLGDAAGDTITINGRLSTLNISDGTTSTSTLTRNSLAIAVDGNNALGKFYVDSSGNVFTTGSLKTFGNVTSTGIIYASGGLISSASSTFSNVLNITGNARASSTLLVGTAAGTDNLFISGNNTYVATSTAYGTAYSLIVGNGTTGALVAGGHAVPSHGSLFNLGSDSLRWSNVYSNTGNVSTTLYVGTGGTILSTLTANNLAFAGSLGVVSSTAGNLRLAADGANQIRFWTNGSQRAFIDSSGNTFASGTLQTTGSILTFGNVTSTGHIYPASGNTADLGALNTAFRNIYASSSINVGAGGTSSTFMGNYLALTDGTSSTILNGSSLTLGQGTAGYNSGMFNVDSNGNVSASGTIKASAGTASLPSFTFQGDPNTGIYNSAADEITAVVGGALSAVFKANSTVNFTNWRMTAGGITAQIQGADTSDGSGYGLKVGNETFLSTAGDKIVGFFPDGLVNEAAYIDKNGAMTMVVSSTLGYKDGRFKVDSSGNVSASGSLRTYGNVTSTGHIYPASGNTADLGALNTAFRNIYASSSINVGASGTSSTFMGNYLALTDGTTTGVLGGGSLQLGQATNFNGGTFAVTSNGSISTSGTLRVFASAVSTDNLGLLISVASTPAAASTTFTSYLGGSDPNGVGLAGFVLNTIGPNGTINTSTAVTNALLILQNNSTNKFLVSPNGNVYANQSFIANQSGTYGIGDVAEYVNLTAGETGEPGDVLVVDLNNPNQYKKSSSAYTKEIAGVISDTGAFIIGAGGEGRAALSLAGLVNTKVTDENGPIIVGDYLVSASKPGYAMKYNPDDGQTAGLVGMALEPLTSGNGKITIMINKGLVNSSGNTTELSVSENSDGTLAASSNLNMKGKSILNIAGLNKMGDLWYIDETGLLVAKEIKADSVQAKKFVVKKKTDAKQTSVGEATILNNSTRVIVENELVTSTSKIFITFRSNPNAFWWISKQEEGMFEVSLSQLSETDLTFDYWIIGTENSDEGDTMQNTDNTTQTIDETNDTLSELPPEQPAETPPTEETETTVPAAEETQPTAPVEEPAVELAPEAVIAPDVPTVEEPILESTDPSPATEQTSTEPAPAPTESGSL
ncbi:MAG: hypothetical protein HY980_01875 [Candidatus Magasanikbacteria bacterium]|nr:hypothetical protein [Candidatus Magasanikbacteria bacterium]